MRRQWVFETLDTTTTTLLRSNIFNRILELEKLKTTVEGDPSRILVVLGPRSCGPHGQDVHFDERKRLGTVDKVSAYQDSCWPCFWAQKYHERSRDDVLDFYAYRAGEI
ncbi:hypothetical protein CEUSTIGMA_g985.t1, partial [Chlamydomonas eustigma]